MGQTRHYEVKTTTVSGITAYDFIACHSPKDFLKHVTMAEGERAKPGKAYDIGQGATLEYKPITKDYYESCQQTLKAAEPEETPASEFTDGLTYSRDEMDAEPGEMCGVQIDDTNPAFDSAIPFLTPLEYQAATIKERIKNGEIRLRLSVNDDSTLTGETVYDNEQIKYHGFDIFLNEEQYNAFVASVAHLDISIVTPAEQMYRFMLYYLDKAIEVTESQVTKIEARVSAPANVATWTAPPSGRRSKSLFGTRRNVRR